MEIPVLKGYRLRVFFAFSVTFLIVSIIVNIFFIHHAYKDPRWRIFDFHSVQSSLGEIYNVAEVPVCTGIREISPRKLRFTFCPDVGAENWKVISSGGKEVTVKGTDPVIQFPDSALSDTWEFKPINPKKHIDLPLKIQVGFYPKENYHKQDLSWPDNYYTAWSSFRFGKSCPRSVDEWAGLPDHDPDVIEARNILRDHIDAGKPTMATVTPSLDKIRDIFTFVMSQINHCGGTPSDEVNDASPMKTYKMLISGEGRGWCENWALVYYLFANAAGVRTRLVDIAGKIGPMKLTGHYFCESYIPEQGRWCFVDPMTRTAYLADAEGKVASTIDIKHMNDVGVTDGFIRAYYDGTEKTVKTQTLKSIPQFQGGYFQGDLVFAYKFGYPRNRSFRKLTNYLFYPTRLYCTFEIPKLYRWKMFFIWCVPVSLVFIIISGFLLLSRSGKK